MSESFDLQSFKEYAEKLIEEFPKKHTIRYLLNNDIHLRHELTNNDDVYSLEYDCTDTSGLLTFYYWREGIAAIYVHINMSGPFEHLIISDEHISEFHDQLRNSGQLDVWTQSLSILEECFKIHYENIQYNIHNIVSLPQTTTSKDDVVAAMEKMFEIYSTEFYGKDKIARKSVKHNSIHLVMVYGKAHASLTLRMEKVVGWFTEELYKCEYNFIQNKLTEKGTKPGGFEEAFAKFKLLGSLMN